MSYQAGRRHRQIAEVDAERGKRNDTPFLFNENGCAGLKAPHSHYTSFACYLRVILPNFRGNFVSICGIRACAGDFGRKKRTEMARGKGVLQYYIRVIAGLNGVMCRFRNFEIPILELGCAGFGMYRDDNPGCKGVCYFWNCNIYLC